MKSFMLNFFVLFVILLFSTIAHAEVEKKEVPCGTEKCTYYWPKLSPIKGWNQEKESSFDYRVKVLIPEGAKIKSAKALIYTNARLKSDFPEAKTLEDFISSDQNAFPEATITEDDPLTTVDGQKMRIFSLVPQKKKGNWEKIGYGEEGDYYLIFVVSARSASYLEKAQEPFKQLIETYKSNP